MNTLHKVKIAVVLFFTAALSISGQIRLPKLISDGMVLQRDIPLKIWGWASAGEKITVHFDQADYPTTTDSNGNWTVTLPPQKAGGPYEMTIEGSDTIVVRDMMLGDVWICSGQSNMELPMRRVAPIYKSEIASANDPYIRQFEVPKTYNFIKPQTDLPDGRWTAADPRSVLDFSAVAYFFAKELHERYQVPIGLINASLGGSPAEAWISEDSLQSYPAYYEEAQRFKDQHLIDRILSEDKTRISAWHNLLYQKDAGYADPSHPWYAENIDASSWPEMNIPGYWELEDDRPLNGVMWFRKTFDLPENLQNRSALLILGCIVDADSVYINGQLVGTTSYQYPPRRYEAPAGILKAGKNSIAVRVISQSGRGGFVEEKAYCLDFGDSIVDLQGPWKYQLGARMEPLTGETFISWKPLGLFNAMIAPLLNYQIKGVIWYQGESNTDRPLEYRQLFATLIRDWRNQWHQGDFPFLFVQLPNFLKPYPEPTESDWAVLRESQLKTLALPNTGMAVAIDIGEWNDVHPLNKKDVGKRLALAARKWAYNEDSIVYSGPVYESMKVEENKIILSFTHTGSGLMVRGDTLHAFAIAGADKQFVWANAAIEQDKVIVWNDQIMHPVAVRYAWANNPENANLYNKEGLPASPFRTDSQ
ncbi:MAG: sialate O-acetylesterase [Candidatus Azobacteroides sp.]|nr:sialate O-acetylesterase [Candidatus Azobacteroides sp.]